MSDLKQTISSEIIKAMKAKDKTRLNALRYVKKLFIENDTSTKPKAELDIIVAYAKKVKDSAKAAELLHSENVLLEGDAPRGRFSKQ